MSAGKLDIYVEQGATFEMKVTLNDNSNPPVPIDLTGHTFRGQIRSSYSSGTQLAAFSFVIADQMTDPGLVTVQLPAASTDGIPNQPANSASKRTQLFAYDIESVDGSGFVKRWLEGVVEFSPQVTK